MMGIRDDSTQVKLRAVSLATKVADDADVRKFLFEHIVEYDEDVQMRILIDMKPSVSDISTETWEALASSSRSSIAWIARERGLIE